LSAPLLYVDTSALLDRVLGQKQHREIARAMRSCAADGGRLVASRLLHLEVRRVQVRERLDGRSLPHLDALASQITALPLTEEVWVGAFAIEQHAKTLDALHLATCQVVGATLLSSDRAMLELANHLGIEVHSSVRLL
jgi:predicted nucleic acid-binding protein